MLPMKIYGIALIKNGVKFDYPFRESLNSLLPLVEKVYINVGTGDDSTMEEIKKLPKMEIIEVNWDDSRSDKGKILSDMTNIPIRKMREEIKEEDAWAFYLQSDELLHEDDYEQIKKDIAKAQAEGFDAVKFRYMHFWQKTDELAVNPNWYPEEIRAFKVNTNIISVLDAQGFAGQKKVYSSDCHIWHYGHVREKEAYKQKSKTLDSYYSKGFNYYRKQLKRKIKKFFSPDKVVRFIGHHPINAIERNKKLDHGFEIKTIPAVHIIGDISKYNKEIFNHLNAGTVTFNDEKHSPNAKIINLNKIKWKKTLSPICKEWTPNFQLVIELSRHGVEVRKHFL